MRPSFIRLGAALFLFATACRVLAADLNSIIAEWPAMIQVIHTQDYENWPGVPSSPPVDISIVGNRIRFIWPGAVISLREDVQADEETLLTLWTSSAHRQVGEAWSPINGALCSDGIWRRVDAASRRLISYDLRTGKTDSVPYFGDDPQAVFPAAGAALIAVLDKGVQLIQIDGTSTSLASLTLPPTNFAFSLRDTRVAWMTLDGVLHVTNYETRKSQSYQPEEASPAAWVWSTAWAGDIPVTAHPGKLTVFDISSPQRRILENQALPHRWYRIISGDNELAIHILEQQTVVVLSNQPSNDGSAYLIPEFRKMVADYGLTAGTVLQESGSNLLTESFYRWLLTHVRSFRSRYPLDETWPNLEIELTERRASLREGF